MKKKLLIGILIVAVSGVAYWLFREKEPVIPAWYGPLSRNSYNDSTFSVGSSDFLYMGNELYLMSESPVFGLPNALKIFSFDDLMPMEVQYPYAHWDDKNYCITWTLSNGYLTLTDISFSYPPEIIEKYYPDNSYLAAFAKGANLTSESDMVATWFSDSVYVQHFKYNDFLNGNMDSLYNVKTPFLKLKFKNGILEKKEELWEIRKKSNPPNPFEMDSTVSK